VVKQIPLTDLGRNEPAVIVEIYGGRGIQQRLSAMGIRPGRRITKISAIFMRGPVTIRVGGADIALGFGTARKIIVGVEV